MASSSQFSIVEYCGGNDGYRCGYCKSTNTNFSHGMWAHRLSVQDYQALIDRGWRRSGQYIYKPTLHLTCCPMYTISCSVLDFKLTKSQKKIIKRMNRFLISDERKPDKDNMSQSSDMELDIAFENVSDIHDLKEKAQMAEKEVLNAEVRSVHPSCIASFPVVEEVSNVEGISNIKSDVPAEGSSTSDVKINNTIEKAMMKQGDGADVSKPVCKKAKLLRLERKKERLQCRGLSEEEIVHSMKKQTVSTGKSIEDLTNESLNKNSKHRLEIRLVHSNPANTEFQASFANSYEVYQKYQVAIHGDLPSKCTQKQYARFLVNSPLQTVLVASGSPEMKRTLSTSWNLFVAYQTRIHKETLNECNMESFLDFLVRTPIKLEQNNSPPSGYGSFHQQYWLDDKLIAVGVIDILPKCVSSVYFYYDPDYSDLSLGTYASLREVSFTRSLHCSAPSIKYYYMGFYIDTCPKMRYKGHLKPSFLLCPETYTWHNFEEAQLKLQKSKYSRLNDDKDAIDQDRVSDINKVLILYHNICMDYKTLRLKKKSSFDDELVEEYASLVGMGLARRLLLVRS